MRMKTVLMIACALFMGASAVNAQNTELPKDGDLFQGLTRSITYDRMIPPHGLQVTFDKTVHIIFPASVTYVDLGSANIMAGKADGAENVIRVKATKRWFKGETNMSVITEDGSFYAFNVKYAKEPDKLNIEMKDFIHDGSAVNRPNNSMDIYLKELGSESPVLVRLVMKSIWKQNERIVKHIGSKGFGIRFLLKGIYTHNGLLYFHTEIKNSSNVPFDVDYVTWKIVDKKVVKRTAIQEQVIQPLRTQNFVLNVSGNSSERTVWTMDKFTLPDDKCLVVELAEKNGGRNQQFVIENSDLVRAKKLLMIGVLALTMGQASAQRCLPKMQGIEVSGAFVDGKPLSAAFSGGVALSTYTKNGSKWVFGGEYLQREYDYDEDTAIPVVQFTAEGGYYQKLLTDASKTLFVYGGASALAGYETVNWGKTLLPDGATLQDRDAFVYGGALTLNVEVYLSDRLALTGSVRERCLWGNDTGYFHTQYGVGHTARTVRRRFA